MTQPEFVPVSRVNRVRPMEDMPPADGWVPDRPAEIKGGRQPTGRRFGTAGPDQGYALKLARQFDKRLQLQDGEHNADAVAGCLGVALRRASLFGRAPVVHDLEHAFTLWGYLGDAPKDLLEYRKGQFQEIAHDYARQRDLVDRVPESTLRMTHVEIRESLATWRQLITFSG